MLSSKKEHPNGKMNKDTCKALILSMPKFNKIKLYLTRNFDLAATYDPPGCMLLGQ